MMTAPPLLVCAMPAEARTVCARADARVLGPGRSSGARLAELLREVTPGCVVSWGVAGALRPELSVGDLVVPRWVCLADGTRLDCRPEHIGLRESGGSVLATAAEAVTQPRARLALRGATGADAVDMESAWLAVACAEAGVPFCAVRAISDAVSSRLPVWVSAVLDSNGRVRPVTLVGALARDPLSVVGMFGMARGMAAACAPLRQVANEATFDSVRAA